ncbi:MAG: hypothetical protein M3P18_14500 [Actinomycetota bacterium]|nr:hypothetical protein [Actinomycetota bacterium]
MTDGSMRGVAHGDAKFSRSFDDVFVSEGIRVSRTPIRAPHANAFAERWMKDLLVECPGLAADPRPQAEGFIYSDPAPDMRFLGSGVGLLSATQVELWPW